MKIRAMVKTTNASMGNARGTKSPTISLVHVIMDMRAEIATKTLMNVLFPTLVSKALVLTPKAHSFANVSLDLLANFVTR